MGEASERELNPEPIKDLRAMRGQSVRRSFDSMTFETILRAERPEGEARRIL